MTGTLKTTYRGWHIAVKCVQQPVTVGMSSESERFTATGHAILHDALDYHAWVDWRPQIVTLGERIFHTSALSIDALHDEIRMLIDALKR
jgi:hypothetical protein